MRVEELLGREESTLKVWRHETKQCAGGRLTLPLPVRHGVPQGSPCGNGGVVEDEAGGETSS